MDWDELIVWCKAQEIKALDRSQWSDQDFVYFDAKASGFADVWQHLVFNGETPHPVAYNQANNYWSARALKAYPELERTDDEE